jgi:hypothetical protein
MFDDVPVKIITLSNDTQLVAGVESVSDLEFRLITPLRISRHYSETETGSMMESFSLMNWIPFSDDQEYYMNRNLIINIANLSRNFVQDYYEVVERTYYATDSEPEASESKLDEDYDDDLIDELHRTKLH